MVWRNSFDWTPVTDIDTRSTRHVVGGGVAGAEPPHKGGPNRPNRTTAVVSGQWLVVSCGDSPASLLIAEWLWFSCRQRCRRTHPRFGLHAQASATGAKWRNRVQYANLAGPGLPRFCSPPLLSAALSWPSNFVEDGFTGRDPTDGGAADALHRTACICIRNCRRWKP